MLFQKKEAILISDNYYWPIGLGLTRLDIFDFRNNNEALTRSFFSAVRFVRRPIHVSVLANIIGRPMRFVR